jgi:HD-like signal output (HDOD) protein/CheY-like chemotaxis protein
MTDDSTDSAASRRPSVLFVDDEPLVLRSLRRSTSARTEAWDVSFVGSAREAIQLLDAGPIDVIVSDMHMPDMDGATLLRHVQDHHPGVVRIVLSGHSDARLVFRSVPVAHQFLTKPFETARLVGAIDRALELRRLLSSPALLGVVAGDSKLPSTPRIYTELTALLSRDDTSLTDVVRLIEADVALSARIAQLASSAFFHVPRSVTTLSGFVRHLGVDVVKTLVLGIEVVSLFRPATPPHVFSAEALQRHSLATCSVVRRIMPRGEHAEEALLAAMLHDVGKLVLASRLPAAYAEAHAAAARRGLPMDAAERLVIGASHAEVGAYLLGIWGLPAAIVEAVERHHDAARQTNGPVDVASAVFVANRLCHDPDAPVHGEDSGLPPALAEHLRASPGMTAWRDAARDSMLADDGAPESRGP